MGVGIRAGFDSRSADPQLLFENSDDTSRSIYPATQKDDVLLRLREDYEQAVLDLFETDQSKEVRPALGVIGHTSNFLDNMRLPIHRWFRYSAGFSAEWVKWLLAGIAKAAIFVYLIRLLVRERRVWRATK